MSAPLRSRLLAQIGVFLGNKTYSTSQLRHVHKRVVLQRLPPSVSFAVNRMCFTTTQVPDDDVEDDLYKRISVELKGHDPEVLKSYLTFLESAAKELDVNIHKISAPKKIHERYTVLKSAFVHRKHLVQYETRTHLRSIEIKHITGSTACTYLEYIQRNMPEGVAMTVTKTQLQQLPDHIKNTMEST